jgi:hypothetical protein
MLKPRPAARFFDVANDFPREWTEFRDNGQQTLTLPITADLLPGMSGGQITGVYTKYQLTPGATAHFVLNGAALTDGTLVPTTGLSLNGGWTLRLDGDKQALTDFGLVLAYQAGV